ncbi:hypothetical protein [Aquimarina sp. 2201CG5-10]|nr:hypothetical protein [Aquimarina sp. 2201CG5-10]MDY8135441.1 hypothetical protein [Aquimarina sp. 2201CG5-10]
MIRIIVGKINEGILFKKAKPFVMRPLKTGTLLTLKISEYLGTI